ncbi:MAG TPA: cytochrome c oxidase assembly protein [Burkholderiales bacterium]|nr:cytochrome c oxidase assembly protein [Burkholderiales bacterium]
MKEVLSFLLPWEFSPAAFALCVGAVAWYAHRIATLPAAQRPGFGRRASFVAGWAAIYFVMQTHFDYLSQHMFFIHRIQHLALHHLGPFLVALALPLPMPAPLRGLARMKIARLAWRALQNWAVAPILFVGLIYLWLTPSIHFDAMLSAPLYRLMNWSMLLDGLLFWGLMLDPRPRRDGALIGFGLRIWLVLLAIPPQIAIGSYIALSQHDLFDVYAVCGRAWGIAAMDDQAIGGIVTWIPAAMMHVVAALILISRWMRFDQGSTPRRAWSAS